MTVDEENKFRFKDASFPENSRDLILHEGDLNLSESFYEWRFGRTNQFTKEDLRLNLGDKESLEEVSTKQAKIEAKDSAAAAQPLVGLHPKNKERKTPGALRCGGQVSEAFMESLGPSGPYGKY